MKQPFILTTAIYTAAIPFAYSQGAEADAFDGLGEIETLEAVTVIGDRLELFTLPGSGYLVDEAAIRDQNYTNINRVLAKVPGVYVREEDGYGNFPNISIRGGDGTRSEKVTVMEDGILTAPAPYSAPAAYYSPKVARMSGVEVLKGSSQIQYGPQTTGGVINYLSTAIPEESKFYSRNTYGTDNTWLSHNYYGNTIETKAGRFGFLFELFHNQSDGFRTIEEGEGYNGSDDTGFRVTEPMVKLFWEPSGWVPQRFEFKYGYTDLDADESYVGLSEEDVDRNPDRRYAGTRFDNITTEQHRTYLKYLIEPADGLKLETALYYNKFERNWRKLDDIEVAGAAADGTGRSLNNVRNALTDPTGLAVLRGRGEGNLVVRNNAREYESYGVQFSGSYEFETGPAEHTLSFGARLHKDYVERDQFDEIYNQDTTGAIVGRQFELNNVRRQETQALALWLKDEVDFGRLTITPGVRYEYIDVEADDFRESGDRVGSREELAVLRSQITRNEGGSGADSYSEFIPGISANLELTDELSTFAGVYKGISIPGPRSFITGTDVEESIGYELGARYVAECVSAEIVGFFTDFQNILNTDAGTGAGGDDTTNGGEAEVFGVEALVNYDPLINSDYSLPMYVSATWTSAEFKSDIVDGGSDGIFNGATNGNEIPYIPDWKLAAGIGFSTDVWGVNVDASYVSETFATGANESEVTTNAREGEIDDLFLVDLSGHFRVSDNVKLIGGVANVFDERGVVSRIPRGPRANQGRTAYIGFEAEF